MTLSAPKMTQTKNKLISLMIADIAQRTFTDRTHQEYWITLLGIESGYENKARSTTGAIGIGQLIASYRADFGKDCGFTDASRDDLDDVYVNASLSACFFRSLIIANDGAIPLALISYNQGLYSKDLHKAKNGASPSLEPSAFTTRAFVKHAQQADKDTK